MRNQSQFRPRAPFRTKLVVLAALGLMFAGSVDAASTAPAQLEDQTLAQLAEGTSESLFVDSEAEKKHGHKHKKVHHHHHKGSKPQSLSQKNSSSQITESDEMDAEKKTMSLVKEELQNTMRDEEEEQQRQMEEQEQEEEEMREAAIRRKQVATLTQSSHGSYSASADDYDGHSAEESQESGDPYKNF